MRVRDIVTAAVAVAWMATAHTSTISARSPQRGTLPAGEGRDTAIRICGDCHEAEQMSNAYRTRVEWETLIEDMASRNGAASEDDKKVILGYALKSFGKVNINTAAADDIAQIVQLPAAQAAAIVDYRQKSGEFKSLEDLRKVPTIDFAKVQERKDRIGFTGP